MVAINGSPVLEGDVYVTKHEAVATSTPTDYVFSTLQDTVHIFNLGYRQIKVVSNGDTRFVDPNDSEKFRGITTISISSNTGSPSFRLEGRTGSTGTGGVDDVARQLSSDNANEIGVLNEQLAESAKDWIRIEKYKNLRVAIADGWDWTPAIQEAIIDNPNGGVLRFYEGDFIVNNIEIPSNFTIMGVNFQGTVIKRSMNNPVFKTTGTPLPNGGMPSITGVTFVDITVSSTQSFSTDLTQFQGTSGMYFERVTFDAYTCRLVYFNQVWDSKFHFCKFANGGNADGRPALELAGGMNGYKQTMEIMISNCWFESYSGSAIRTQRDSATAYKTTTIQLDNIKFESVNCTGNHLNLEANNLQFNNIYISTQYTTSDVVKLTSCRGIQGSIRFYYIGSTVPASLIHNDSGCTLIDINILVAEPQPSTGNVVTNDNTSDNTIKYRITAQKPMINSIVHNRVDMNQGAIWFDSNNKPRISSGKPSNIDTSGIPIMRTTYGNTAGRTTGLGASDTGTPYFDNTVAKPLTWNGGSWRDAFNCMPENVGINAAVNASVTSLAVVLPTAEPVSTYAVSVAPTWNTTWWITNKLNTGFTVNFGTAPASASTLDWTIKK